MSDDKSMAVINVITMSMICGVAGTVMVFLMVPAQIIVASCSLLGLAILKSAGVATGDRHFFDHWASLLVLTVSIAIQIGLFDPRVPTAELLLLASFLFFAATFLEVAAKSKAEKKPRP